MRPTHENRVEHARPHARLPRKRAWHPKRLSRVERDRREFDESAAYRPRIDGGGTATWVVSVFLPTMSSVAVDTRSVSGLDCRPARRSPALSVLSRRRLRDEDDLPDPPHDRATQWRRQREICAHLELA